MVDKNFVVKIQKEYVYNLGYSFILFSACLIIFTTLLTLGFSFFFVGINFSYQFLLGIHLILGIAIKGVVFMLCGRKKVFKVDKGIVRF